MIYRIFLMRRLEAFIENALFRKRDMSNQDNDVTALGRRGLLLGGALASLAAASGQAAAGSAERTSMGVAVEPLSSPGIPSIGSPALDGHVYRAVVAYEFVPYFATAVKTFGGFGVYAATSGGPMRACVDIAPGALVGDVEFYLYNVSTDRAVGTACISVPGELLLSSIGAVAIARPRVPSVVAVRAVPMFRGPFPLGTKLCLTVDTPPDGTVQIVGARVGFLFGGGQIALQPKQVRVLNTKTDGGPVAAGEKRAVVLSETHLPPGTTGVILRVTTVGATTAGNLNVFGYSSPPAYPNVYYGASVTSAAELTIPVGVDRKVNILASTATHVALDIVGTIA